MFTVIAPVIAHFIHSGRPPLATAAPSTQRHYWRFVSSSLPHPLRAYTSCLWTAAVKPLYCSSVTTCLPFILPLPRTHTHTLNLCNPAEIFITIYYERGIPYKVSRSWSIVAILLWWCTNRWWGRIHPQQQQPAGVDLKICKLMLLHMDLGSNKTPTNNPFLRV